MWVFVLGYCFIYSRTQFTYLKFTHITNQLKVCKKTLQEEEQSRQKKRNLELSDTQVIRAFTKFETVAVRYYIAIKKN